MITSDMIEKAANRVAITKVIDILEDKKAVSSLDMIQL